MRHNVKSTSRQQDFENEFRGIEGTPMSLERRRILMAPSKFVRRMRARLAARQDNAPKGNGYRIPGSQKK